LTAGYQLVLGVRAAWAIDAVGCRRSCAESRSAWAQTYLLIQQGRGVTSKRVEFESLQEP